MQSALYYPFTGPERQSFLKTALFLWDSVDFIVPFRGFRPRGKTEEEDEALEIGTEIGSAQKSGAQKSGQACIDEFVATQGMNLDSMVKRTYTLPFRGSMLSIIGSRLKGC